MKLLTSLEAAPEVAVGRAVTIGKYDGIHLGHQLVLQQLLDEAESLGLDSAVITFEQHPNSVLNPQHTPLPVIGNSQKQELLEQFGVGLELQLSFDIWFASLSPRQFVEAILVDFLKTKLVIVGDDFKFGAGAQGDLAELKSLGVEFGFDVRAVEGVLFDGRRISTTLIRDLLDQGEVVKAARLLGRNHKTTGVIEHGLKIGRKIGFPTANMTRDCEGYLPVDGVYAGWLHCEGQRYPAALSVGTNDTFQAVPRLVEAYVLDETTLDLYDKIVTLEYIDFIRPAAKFSGVEELITEIKLDVEKIRHRLAKEL